MKEERILNVLGQVDEEYIEEAAPAVKRRSKKPGWVKWGALAACLALFVAVAGIVGSWQNWFGHKGGPASNPDSMTDPVDSLVQDMRAFEFNGAYYEVTDVTEALERYGLPAAITEDMAGRRLSFLESDGGAGYKESAAETDVELFEYALAPCRGVYVVRDGGKYLAALFCGIIAFDSNTNTEMETLYRFYGIDGADDIASVAEVDWNRNETVGNAVTGSGEIAAFYEISRSLVSYGNDDFQALVFDGIPEDQQSKVYNDFADDLRVIRIETMAGLRFYIDAYPSYGWLYGNGTLSYYIIDAQMSEWIADNLK